MPDDKTAGEWLLTPEEMMRGAEISAAPMRDRCSALPIDPEREKMCQEPYHWDDGIPYCDTCGLFRSSVRRP